MNSSSRAALALTALVLVTACANTPSSPAGLLIVDRAPRFGQPAVAGVDGPFGMTGSDIPVQPWLGAPPVQRTTADIMVDSVRTARRVVNLNAPRFRKIRPDRHNLPQNPDALPDAPAALQDRAPRPFTASTVVTPTVDLATVAETGALPPDTMGDVGPTQYFAALNGRFRTFNKVTGVADGVIDADSDVFFNSVSGGGGTSDPRIRYDRRTNRWFLVMITAAVPSRFLIAVSNGPTIAPSTIWSFFQWTNTRTQGGAGGGASCLGDYETLGIDADALYIGANQFCGASINSLTFDSTSAYVVNKPALVGGTLAVSAFDAVLPSGGSTGMYTPQGVDNFDASTNTGYFIGVDNAQFGRLVVRRVTNVTGTPALSADIGVTVPATAFPGTVPQAGTTARFDGLDDRLLQAVIRNGRLWTAHQINVTAAGAASGSGTRNGVRWYEVANLATSPTLNQSGTVFDSAAANPLFFWMGSVMPNGQGHVALGMSVSGALTAVNTAVTGRLAGDAAGVMDPPVAYSNSSAVYQIQGAGTTQRWGDYSYTSVDPDDDMTMWTLQEYADAANSYAVRLTRLLAPPPAAITAVTPATLPTGVVGAIVTVTGSNANGRGFFEPGPGFLRHLAASLGAGVTVTGVTVTSPTSLTLSVDVAANATSGARTLTVTNPDGQTSTASFTIGSGVNQAPVFGVVPANRTVFDAGGGATTGPLAFTVGDPEGSVLAVAASSSNLAVIPAAGLTLGGSGTDRTITVNSAGVTGASTITLSASDGALTTTATFVVTVSPSGVPGAPVALTATAMRNTLTFAWQPPATAVTEPVSGYVLEAGLTPGGVLGTLPLGNVLTTTLTAPSGVYFLRVRAQTAAGLSAPSNEVQVAAGEAAPPLAPLALLATVQGLGLTMQWTENPLGPVIAAYQLQAGSAPGLSDIGVLPLPNTARSFAITASPGTYYVRVVAVNAAGSSTPSNEAVISPGPGTCTIPAVPSGFAAASLPGQLSVSWNAPASGAIPLTYVLQAGSVSGASDIGSVALPGSTTSAAGPVPPGPYFLRVFAVNACGTSAASVQASTLVP